MAWADGDVSADEKLLLEKLVARYFSYEDGSVENQEAVRQLAAWTVDSSVLAKVILRLTSVEERTLALKLSSMMAKVGQRPQESSLMNPIESSLQTGGGSSWPE
ncbi:MAG: hypothetical protein O2839_09380 [Cyanobacteria bacterium]|nr:hypothetical protein [Cyanobacteriota bacterium]